MIASGKCPKCEKVVSHVSIEDMPIYLGFQEKWKGVSYLCQHCKTILGVGIDPIALKTDIVQELRKALGK